MNPAKNNLAKLIPVTFLCLLMAISCGPTEGPAGSSGSEENPSGFIHAVYFWLNDSLSHEQHEEFVRTMDTLATLPSIQNVYYGPPAGTPRQVVDNSYDYAFIVFFSDKAGHDAYQEHPLHKKFKEQTTHLIRDVRIYDSLFPN